MITTTIRSELESYLNSSGLTINRFAEISSVNSGTISSIINGTRPISMQQLDRITSGMGLPEGTFYDLYVDECFQQSPNWGLLNNQKILISQGFRGTFVEFICKENTENR